MSVLRCAWWSVWLWVASGAAVASDEAVRQAAVRIGGEATVEWIRATPSNQLRAVKFVGNPDPILVSEDGKVVIAGARTVVDAQSGRDIAATWRASVMREALESVPADLRIVFKASPENARISVWTDVDCGYCRRMHQDVSAFVASGISVEYVLFARSGAGTPTYQKHAQVMCAANRGEALTAAKRGYALPAQDKECAVEMAALQQAGERAGLTGTPAVALQDGTTIGGYVTPAQVLQAVAQQASRK